MKLKLRKILIVFCIVPGFFSAQSQEMIISTNVKIDALPGTSIILANGMNLVNHSTSVVLNGKYIFQGNLPQNIEGNEPVEFADLSVEQGAFLSLFNDVKVNGKLNLSNGIINLLDKNITLESGATINGTFSENAMLVAEGTGKLGFEITTNGTYFFPVGDTSDVYEYSPVSLVFNKGTYNNALVSVNLKNKKHPDNSSTTDYINRYWTVSQTGISGFECDANFKYASADIHGNESNIYGASWNGSFWVPLNKSSLNSFSGKVSSFSDFTGGELNAVFSEDLIEDHVEVLNNDNHIIIKSDGNIKLKSAEVYNHLGQKLSVKDLSKSNYNEIKIEQSGNVFLVRIISDKQVFTKKVIIY